MKLSIKNYFEPKHVEALLSKLCEKYNVNLRSIDMYIRLERNKEYADTYAAGTVEQVGYLFKDICKRDPETLDFSDQMEVLTTSEVKERTCKIKEQQEIREAERREKEQKQEEEEAKGYVGLVQRGGFFRFMGRQTIPRKGKEDTMLKDGENLLFIYYVPWKDKVKEGLRQKYTAQAIDDNPRQSLFNLDHDDIMSIKAYLESISIEKGSG